MKVFPENFHDERKTELNCHAKLEENFNSKDLKDDIANLPNFSLFISSQKKYFKLFSVSFYYFQEFTSWKENLSKYTHKSNWKCLVEKNLKRISCFDFDPSRRFLNFPPFYLLHLRVNSTKNIIDGEENS